MEIKEGCQLRPWFETLGQVFKLMLARSVQMKSANQIEADKILANQRAISKHQFEKLLSFGTKILNRNPGLNAQPL